MKKTFIYIILIITIFSVYFNSTSLATELSSNISNSVVVNEQTDINSLPIYSDCILMVEKETGDILYNKNAYEKMYPASTTKMLTAILVLENCDLNEIATVSSTALRAVPATYTTSNLQVRRKVKS